MTTNDKTNEMYISSVTKEGCGPAQADRNGWGADNKSSPSSSKKEADDVRFSLQNGSRSALCSYWCATRWEREPKKKKNEEILVRIGSGSKIDWEMDMSFFVRREADHISNDNNTRTTRWKIKYGRWITNKNSRFLLANRN
jgi:hypothetical protein